MVDLAANSAVSEPTHSEIPFSAAGVDVMMFSTKLLLLLIYHVTAFSVYSSKFLIQIGTIRVVGAE
jgi:hypothetical protein